MNIGIIGIGRMGLIRAENAVNFGGTKIHIFDNSPEKCSKQHTIGGKEYNCLPPEQINWKGLDVVFICTPPDSHCSYMEKAIDNNVNCMVEKPLGLNADEFIILKEKADEKNLISAVGFMNRYRHSITSLKEKVQHTYPLAVHAYWFGGKYNVPWWSDVKKSGGPVNDQLSHLIDTLRYVLGEIDEASVIPLQQSDESASINLRFKSGCVGSALYSCLAAEKSIGLEIYFETERTELLDWNFRTPETPVENPEVRNQIFKTETDTFLNAVLTKNPKNLRSDLGDAIKTQQIIDKIKMQIINQKQLQPAG